jgi:hypothetical protein
VELLAFEQALADLTVPDIRLISLDLVTVKENTADEVACTRSVLVIEQTLRRTHRLHNAASAALEAASTVQEVAELGNVALPDDDVTRVARAAAQLARGLVVGDSPGVDEALRCLGRGWYRMPCLDELRVA